MKCRLIIISFLAFVLMIGTGCFGNKKDDTPEGWLGRYTYREPANTDGIIVSWEIIINRLNGEYLSILNASSAKGNSSYSANVSVNNGELFVVFDKSYSRPEPSFQKSDTLLSLKKRSGKIRTTWKKLIPPSLQGNTVACDCFIFRGLNENNNSISLP